MPLLTSNQTCTGCRERKPCWMAITDRMVISCAECWDTERDGPLPVDALPGEVVSPDVPAPAGPFCAAWQQVTCSGCAREYRCVPNDDYYHRPDVADADRTLTNGVCEPCLLGFKGPDDVRVRRPQG